MKNEYLREKKIKEKQNLQPTRQNAVTNKITNRHANIEYHIPL